MCTTHAVRGSEHNKREGPSEGEPIEQVGAREPGAARLGRPPSSGRANQRGLTMSFGGVGGGETSRELALQCRGTASAARNDDRRPRPRGLPLRSCCRL